MTTTLPRAIAPQGNVMAGLVLAIHAFMGRKVVDARPKAGHDGVNAGEAL